MQKPFIALQLYTVRDFAEKDAADTLGKVKEMGYDYVELAGTYGMDFAELKTLLDETGLCAISAHVQYSALEADMKATIAAYKSLGCEYIIIPMVGAEKLPGGSEYEDAKKVFTEFCAACTEAGVVPAYHNHAHEFEVIADKKFKLDKLFEDISQMKAQLDTGWIKAAGQNPEAYITKYAERCPIVHLKDTVISSYSGYEDRPVGQGSQDIPATIRASLAAGVVGFVAELDKAVGYTSLDAASESRKYLKSLGY